MSSLIYHPEAEIEALHAFEWYAGRSHDAAARFESELAEAERQVVLYPARWARYLHGTQRFSLRRYPFALIYLPKENHIYGVAVAHLHRRPGYWKERLN